MSALAYIRQAAERSPFCSLCTACRKPLLRFLCFLSLSYSYIPIQLSVGLSRSLSRLASIPKWILNMRCPKQTGELYSTRCHSVKWLPAYDHLKYPDSEPYAGLAFRCMSILFTSMMLFATRRVFSISTNAICAYGRSEEHTSELQSRE